MTIEEEKWLLIIRYIIYKSRKCPQENMVDLANEALKRAALPFKFVDDEILSFVV